MIRALDRRRWLAAAFAAGLLLPLVFARSADAGAVCTYVADPESAQFPGGEVSVVGSFSDHANGQIGIGLFPEEPQPGQFQPIAKLGANGTTNAAGNFDETREIPGDMEPGVYRLAVYEISGGLLLSEPPGCYEEYTVLQFIVVVPITTTTTMGLASPTTTEAVTTTTAEATTTSAAETTTTADEATTTTEAEEADGGGGIPAWALGLIAVLAVAALGWIFFLLGRRRREQAAGSASEPPPPPPAG